MPEWMWILLGISFITTIFFAVLRGMRDRDIDKRLRRIERDRDNNDT